MTREVAQYLARKAATQVFHDYVIAEAIKTNIMEGKVLVRLTNQEDKERVSVAAYWLGYKVTEDTDGLVLSWV